MKLEKVPEKLCQLSYCIVTRFLIDCLVDIYFFVCNFRIQNMAVLLFLKSRAFNPGHSTKGLVFFFYIC